jgi:hypothetical protein
MGQPAHGQSIARTVVNRIAVTRGLTPPWPGADAPLPDWLESADVATWGVVELGEMRQRLLDPRQRQAHGVVYTPPEVVNWQVPTALDKANLDRVAHHRRPLEHIHIHDPFCGPGIFLLVAAWYVARWYAPDDPQAALPEVFAECIYGTDLDEVAIDLAKSACWLEINGGRPITFMDRNIAVGDTFADELPAQLAERWPIKPPTAA